MQYPKFFDEVEKISIKDELSNLLGAFEDGAIEYSYLDVVKSAGHSCPTVAGAYLCVKEALKQFSNPKRGELHVYLKAEENVGTSGVTAAVISQLTGATSKNGFHGLAGKFDRRGLLHFEADIPSALRIEDKKEGLHVDVDYEPGAIPMDEELQGLMAKVTSGNADAKEQKAFGEVWQKRVAEILKNPESVLRINVVQ